jgi:hypothetical protein
MAGVRNRQNNISTQGHLPGEQEQGALRFKLAA